MDCSKLPSIGIVHSYMLHRVFISTQASRIYCQTSGFLPIWEVTLKYFVNRLCTLPLSAIELLGSLSMFLGVPCIIRRLTLCDIDLQIFFWNCHLSFDFACGFTFPWRSFKCFVVELIYLLWFLDFDEGASMPMFKGICICFLHVLL